uniref:Metallothionein n=1 Tax=Mycena chlorophos TaxID=658473 RepID=A0ABQ0LA41_MYCCL|nr:predicted protein [Mycena chlorophos]
MSQPLIDTNSTSKKIEVLPSASSTDHAAAAVIEPSQSLQAGCVCNTVNTPEPKTMPAPIECCTSTCTLGPSGTCHCNCNW